MRRNDHAFVNQLLMCLLVSICFGGSIGLGTVWMRQQISQTANTNRQLAAQTDELKRRIDEVGAQIEREQNPDLLRRRNEAWNLGLVPVSDAQVMHVTENPIARLMQRAGAGGWAAAGESAGRRPATVTLRVSLNR